MDGRLPVIFSLVVIVALVILNIVPRTDRPEEEVTVDKSIAVLPFKSLSDDPEKQYLADGVMDAILLDLSKIGDLRVIARTSVAQYRDTEKTATEICGELGVGYVLEGSFQKYGDHARLIVQLIVSGEEDHAWSAHYDRNWTDIFSVQSEVAQTVASELHAVITPAESQHIEKAPTDNMDAYEYFLLGRHLLKEGYTESIYKAIDYYKKAMEIDSGFVMAYTYLAYCYGNLAFMGTLRPVEAYPEARKLAEKVLELDSLASEAYEIMAIGDYFFYYDFDRAEKNLLRAIEMDPNNPKNYRTYADIYCYQGKFTEAVAMDQRAMALDPLYPFTSVLPGLHLYFAGEQDSAISLLRTVYSRDKGARLWLGFLYQQEGNYERAIFEIEKSEDLSSPFSLTQLGLAYSKTSNMEMAQSMLDTLEARAADEFISFTLRGALLAELGQEEEALDYLRKGYEEREEYLLMLQHFDKIAYSGLRSHPEYMEIIRNVQAK